MAPASSRMRDVFLASVLARMKTDRRLFFLSADFGSPVLDVVARDYPDRFINVGIAEQNLINVATGLALEGFVVVAYAIAPFLSMRCYEQIRVNLGILSQVRPLNVNMVGVGAGLSYDVSGPTHQALEDLSIMRTLPNVEVLSPADGASAGAIAEYCLEHSGPKYVRLDGKPLASLYETGAAVNVEMGFHEWRRGTDVCLVATGYMVHTALKAAQILEAENLSVGVVDMFALSKYKASELSDVLGHYQTVITIEEGFVGKGGLDACLNEALGARGGQRVHALGLPSRYSFRVGDRDEMLRDSGLGEVSIAAKARECLRR